MGDELDRSLAAEELDRLRADGVVVVDTRDRHAFAAGHVPGAVSIELGDDLGSSMAALWPDGTRFALVVGAAQDRAEVRRECAGVHVVGILAGVEAWPAAGLPLAGYGIADVDGMAAALRAGAGRALDVRRPDEWREGHVPGAAHIPILELPPRVGELAGEPPVYVYCRSGHRASIGASLLAAVAVPVILVDGGFPDWQSHHLPVEMD